MSSLLHSPTSIEALVDLLDSCDTKDRLDSHPVCHHGVIPVETKAFRYDRLPLQVHLWLAPAMLLLPALNLLEDEALVLHPMLVLNHRYPPTRQPLVASAQETCLPGRGPAVAPKHNNNHSRMHPVPGSLSEEPLPS
jgi:hypothetical protein